MRKFVPLRECHSNIGFYLTRQADPAKAPALRPVLMACGCGAAYALRNTSGTGFSLECAKFINLSIQFSVINAAIMIVTTLISITFLHEKLHKNNIIGVLLALAGIIVYSL